MWSIVGPFSASHEGDTALTGNIAHERVIMANTSPAVVKLAEFPGDLQEVTVKRTNAQVTLDGNGKTIDGQSEQILGTLYDGAHMIYTDAAGEWSFI